jgi:hypothetical protein
LLRPDGIQATDYTDSQAGIEPGHLVGRVLGFVTALNDGVLSGFMPLLEVLPAYHDRDTGQELMTRMLDLLGHLPKVDLLCDPDFTLFRERFGMKSVVGMVLRRPMGWPAQERHTSVGGCGLFWLTAVSCGASAPGIAMSSPLAGNPRRFLSLASAGTTNSGDSRHRIAGARRFPRQAERLRAEQRA